VRGVVTAAIVGLKIPHIFSNFWQFDFLDAKMGPGPWLLLGRFVMGVANKTRFADLSWSILVTWQNQHCWDLFIKEMWLDIYWHFGFYKFHSCVLSHETLTLRKKTFLPLAFEIASLSVVTQDSWPSVGIGTKTNL